MQAWRFSGRLRVAALLALVAGVLGQLNEHACKVAEPITTTFDILFDPTGLELTAKDMMNAINSPDFLGVFTDAGESADDVCSWEIVNIQAVDNSEFQKYLKDLEGMLSTGIFSKLMPAQQKAIKALRDGLDGQYFALGFNGAISSALHSGLAALMRSSDLATLTAMSADENIDGTDLFSTGLAAIDPHSCRLECLSLDEREKERSAEECQCVDLLFSTPSNTPFIKSYQWKNIVRRLVDEEEEESHRELKGWWSAWIATVRARGSRRTGTQRFRNNFGGAMKRWIERVRKQRLARKGSLGATPAGTSSQTAAGSMSETVVGTSTSTVHGTPGGTSGGTEIGTAPGTVGGTLEGTEAGTSAQTGASRITSAPTSAPRRKLDDTFHDISYEELLDLPLPEEN